MRIWIILIFSRQDSGLGRNYSHRCGISQQSSILTSKETFWPTYEGWKLETPFCGGSTWKWMVSTDGSNGEGSTSQHFIGGCPTGHRTPLILLPILFNNWQKTFTVQSEVYQYADDIQLGICISSQRER